MLTRQLVAVGCDVIGVDASPDMVSAATKLGLDVKVMDGHALTFDNEFDAVFSNAALHWMKRPSEVIAGVYRALKPGGRFVGEFGGHGNIAVVSQALAEVLDTRDLSFSELNPWYFPNPDEYAQQLTSHSFAVDTCVLIPRRTVLSTDLTGWLRVFARTFLAALPASEHKCFLQDVANICGAELQQADGTWTVDYVRLRFRANKL